MRRNTRFGPETGSSLIIVLLLLMVVSGLVAAMVSSSMTDTMVSRNHHSGAQAQAAAEAGLNHAIDASRTFLKAWNSSFSNTNEAVSRLLRGPDNDAATTADNGSLAPGGTAPWLTNGTPTPPAVVTLDGVMGVTYEARVFDDDDPALQNSFVSADLIRMKEGTVVAGVATADATIDRNGCFVVRATGYAPGNAVVTVEALMKPLPWPAIVTNGDMLFAGSPQVTGDGGSVHANGNVTVQNPACTITKDVTAVGDVNTPSGWTPTQGIAEGGQLPIQIPSVNVSDYVSQATYKLGDDGKLYTRANAAAAWVFRCNGTNVNPKCSTFGFDWDWTNHSISGVAGITGKWNVNGLHNCGLVEANLGLTAGDCGRGIYYAQNSDVTMSGNIGFTGSPSPFPMTLLVDGSIEISGNPKLTPSLLTPKTLFVTNGDLKMTGTANCFLEGQSRVREQFELGGNMTLTGQILVENRYDHSNVATENKMYGNATVNNPNLEVYDFSVAGWREFRR